MRIGHRLQALRNDREVLVEQRLLSFQLLNREGTDAVRRDGVVSECAVYEEESRAGGCQLKPCIEVLAGCKPPVLRHSAQAFQARSPDHSGGVGNGFPPAYPKPQTIPSPPNAV